MWKRKLGSHNEGVWAGLDGAMCLPQTRTLGLRLALPVIPLLGVGGDSGHGSQVRCQEGALEPSL